MSRLTTIVLAALALSACAPDVPRGPAPVAYTCPEIDPAQPNCRVPRYATVGDLIAGERLVQP